MRKSSLSSLGLVVILVAACGSGGGAASPAVPSSAASSAASTTPSSAASGAPSANAETCAKEDLAVVTPGKFTIGTDNPAFPPYYAEPDAGAQPTEPWKNGDPTNGKGFESAVGYAIAQELGFAKDEVEWVVVPFLNSYAPGPKAFDIDLNQVGWKQERAETADLSDGYYFGNQSLVTLKDSPYATATTIAELKDGLFGAQVGTTSLDAINAVIAPTTKPLIFDTNDLAVKALGNKTIDGIMVDLPTADYITNVQVDDSVIVGQFAGGEPEFFSAVLAKGSPLTECVNAAIDTLSANGTFDDLVTTWLPFQDQVPVISE